MRTALAIGVALIVSGPIAAQPYRNGQRGSAVTDLQSTLALQPAASKHDRAVQTALIAENGDPQLAQQAILEQKLAESDRLQREIEQLRIAIGLSRQILVRAKIVEINRTKLRELGVDFAAAGWDELAGNDLLKHHFNSRANRSNGVHLHVIEPSNALLTFIDSLEESRIAKVLAEPTIATVSGRPASLHIGSEIPFAASGEPTTAPRSIKTGTEIDLIATKLGGERIRLEVRFSVSEPDYSREVTIDGVKLPVISRRQADTGIELTSGHTAILSGMVERRTVTINSESGPVKRPEEVEVLFIVAPCNVN